MASPGFPFHCLLIGDITSPWSCNMHGKIWEENESTSEDWTAATVNKTCSSVIYYKMKLNLIFYPHYYYLSPDGDWSCKLFTFTKLLNQVFICMLLTWWTWWGSWWSPTRCGNVLPGWTRWAGLWGSGRESGRSLISGWSCPALNGRSEGSAPGMLNPGIRKEYTIQFTVFFSYFI